MVDMRGQELDSVILEGPFQLRTFGDSLVPEAQLPPWGAEGGQNSKHLTHRDFSHVAALAVGAFAVLCGASFPYFQAGRTGIAGSGSANNLCSEKGEGWFIQHVCDRCCQKRVGESLAVFYATYTVV